VDAKKYLQQIKKIDTLIKNKNIEAKQAEKMGVDSSYIKNSIRQLQKDRQDIIDDIQRLDEAEYDVLHKRYVQGKTLYEIADERDISYSMVTTIHGRALKHFALIVESKPIPHYCR